MAAHPKHFALGGSLHAAMRSKCCDPHRRYCCDCSVSFYENHAIGPQQIISVLHPGMQHSTIPTAVIYLLAATAAGPPNSMHSAA